MKKATIIAPLVCAVGLFVAGCQDKAAAPGGASSGKPMDVAKAAANTLETSGPLLTYATVDYNPREHPNFIAPCFFVLKGLRQAAISGDKFLIDYKITYKSGGREVTKEVTTRLSQSLDHVHDTNPDSTRFIALADHIDVSDHLPDVGTEFTGSATLVKDTGETRVVQATVTLPAR